MFDDEQQCRYDQKQLEYVLNLPSTQRHYCEQCGLLFSELELSVHCDHAVKQNITDMEMQHPTSFLGAVGDRKSQAVSHDRIILDIYKFSCYLFRPFYFSNFTSLTHPSVYCMMN